jgi:hypothetical protein
LELRLHLKYDDEGRQFWVAATERGDAGRLIVRADENLTAFLELESAVKQSKILGKDKNSCY